MLDISSLGRYLIIAGLVLVIFGAIFTFGGRLSWFGKLPGDFYVQKNNFSFYFPLTTSIIISVVLSIVMILLRKR